MKTLRPILFFLFSFILLATASAANSVRFDFEVSESSANEIGTIFVIDNSGSMGPHQNNIIKKSSTYFQQLTQITNKFGVAVLSTDIQDDSYGIVTHEDTDPLWRFNTIVSTLGTNGDADEVVIDSINKFINSSQGQAFLLEKTFLNIVIISDEDEQSQMSAHDFLISLNFSSKQLNISSFVKDQECSGVELKNQKYKELARLTSGNVYSICADYSQPFQDILTNISSRLPADTNTGKVVLPFRTFNLRYKPEISSVKIFYGSQVIPYGYFRVGWTYDPSSNRIFFGEDVELDQNQPKGTRLTIQYETRTF